jgi:hypothetical protein
MPILMIKCPNTGQAVPTGIETDADSFAILSDTPSQTKCPVCGAMHVWWKREAWLAVDGVGELPTKVVGPRLKKRKPRTSKG